MTTKAYGPFQVSDEDIERSSTLTCRDIDKWALLVCGAYHFFESKQKAQSCKRKVEGA